MANLADDHYSKSGPAIAGSEEARDIIKNTICDQRFVMTMELARRRGLENPPAVGVVKTPGTDHPRFTPHRAIPMIRSQSPGALCAEVAASDRVGSDLF